MSVVCHNCGGCKPDDRYQACPDCRAEWRARARKPGGPAEKIERLTAENEILRAKLARLEHKIAILDAFDTMESEAERQRRLNKARTEYAGRKRL